ncbi:MAG: hypothetical protein F6K11_18045 [Leptolyngbya sp. SIO3F4]|nr:hypothetical protein [Leptolyngbya sp. SIO3F4]
MTVRWKLMLKVCSLMLLVPLALTVAGKLLLPRYATCMRIVDGEPQQDKDAGCYDPNKPKPVTILRLKNP